MRLGIERPRLLRSLNDTRQAVQFTNDTPVFNSAIFKHTLDNPSPMLVKVDCRRFNVPKETSREARGIGFRSRFTRHLDQLGTNKQ